MGFAGKGLKTTRDGCCDDRLSGRIPRGAGSFASVAYASSTQHPVPVVLVVTFTHNC